MTANLLQIGDVLSRINETGDAIDGKRADLICQHLLELHGQILRLAWWATDVEDRKTMYRSCAEIAMILSNDELLRQTMEAMVSSIPGLERYENIILHDWQEPIGEHERWVIFSDTEDVEAWAREAQSYTQE